MTCESVNVNRSDGDLVAFERRRFGIPGEMMQRDAAAAAFGFALF